LLLRFDRDKSHARPVNSGPTDTEEVKEANHRHRLLLRGSKARQSYRAAKRGNGALTVHSILMQPQPHENWHKYPKRALACLTR